MNLLNIPKSYIPSSAEMNMLSSLVEHTAQNFGLTPQDHGMLRELQRKLCLLDSVFRADEEPSWDEYSQRLSEGFDRWRRGQPYPTDENGSFEVAP